MGEGGGIGNAIIGSLVLLGSPLPSDCRSESAVGVYLSEIGRGRFGDVVRFIVDTLTGIPSIVTGVFVYAILVLPMKHFSALAGGVALALIMIPIVARTTEEMLKLVPHSLREGALALGAPQWRVTLGVVIPAAAPGIATGAMLAIARVSGETAPLLFTAFGSRFFPSSLNEPIASLTVQIYNYAISPYDEWHAQAWAATLVLMTLVLGINIIVRFLTQEEVLATDLHGLERIMPVQTAAPKIEVRPSTPSRIPGKAKVAVRNLNFFYGRVQALHDISLEIPERIVMAFIGPSGCGKSTFLRTLNRMNDVIPGTRVGGQVSIDGHDIYAPGTDVVELRRRVGMVFQKSNPFPKSIFDNVAYGLRINKITKQQSRTGGSGRTSAEGCGVVE